MAGGSSGAAMTMMEHKETGQIAKLVHSEGDYVWLKGETGMPWTARADSYRLHVPTPMPGDVWAHSTQVDSTKYICVGVDEKRGMWHMIAQVELDGEGNPFAEPAPISERAVKSSGHGQSKGMPFFMFSRKLPEKRMVLRDRP